MNMKLNFRKIRLRKYRIPTYRTLVVFTVYLTLPALLPITGCEKAELVAPNIEKQKIENEQSVYQAFEPVRTEVIPLTGIKSAGKKSKVIELYISFLDKYGESVKAPVQLRFELYKYIERSGRIKGSRIYMWSDIDITGFEINSEHWQQHLDAYKFSLNLNKNIRTGKYVLHCSCKTASGNRISGDYILNYRE